MPQEAPEGLLKPPKDQKMFPNYLIQPQNEPPTHLKNMKFELQISTLQNDVLEGLGETREALIIIDNFLGCFFLSIIALG